jgi:shikimate kinase
MSVSRIYLVGFMGSGKTTVGHRLAKKLGWKFIDLDEEIERHERRTVADIFRQDGEAFFRQLEHHSLKQASSSKQSVIALGGGAFVDPENRVLAENTGLTVWLKVSFAKVGDRVKIDGTRPKLTSKEQAEGLYQSREPYYALAKLHVSTDDGTPETIAEEIMQAVRKL